MQKLNIRYDNVSGQIFEIEKIPEIVLKNIATYYLHLKRDQKLSKKLRIEIAKKAAKKSAEVRSEKARLGTLKKYKKRVI